MLVHGGGPKLRELADDLDVVPVKRLTVYAQSILD
jgi:hypothetical protein